LNDLTAQICETRAGTIGNIKKINLGRNRVKLQ